MKTALILLFATVAAVWLGLSPLFLGLFPALGVAAVIWTVTGISFAVAVRRHRARVSADARA